MERLIERPPNPATETFSAAFQLQDDPELLIAGGFAGYASVFSSIVDTFPNRTKFERGAFLQSSILDRDRIKILWQHSTSEPIGRVVNLDETERGLWVSAELAATERGKEVVQLLQLGIIAELSIGFDVVASELRTGPDDEIFRHVTEAKLWEISVVSFGADSQAKISSVLVVGDDAVAATQQQLKREQIKRKRAERTITAYRNAEYLREKRELEVATKDFHERMSR